MKIELDKAFVFIVYIYLISICYNIAYWGAFDIDVFNYYDSQSLIQGVTSPLWDTFIGAILITIGHFILQMLSGTALVKWIRNLKWYYLLGAAVLISGGWLGVVKSGIVVITQTKPSVYSMQQTAFEGMRYLFLTICVILALTTQAIVVKDLKSRTVNEAYFCAIYFLWLFPFYAYMSGKQNAWAIERNLKFNYVLSDSILGHKEIYKYLGKAGENYFLVSLDNVRKCIVPAEKLAPMELVMVTTDDPSSMHRFQKAKEQVIVK
ncbi:hypothetical protein GCM10023185_33360 [Hymenobacter saemangeumensis]|uniref:Uncharacterized protein n=1 Tax=Hymenobacter saemangeumensis TaxID=1084522 RepID=A0ABP8INB2_9BACT